MHPKVCLADNSDRLPVDRANHGLLDIDVGKLGKASTKDAGDMGSQRRFVGGSTKLVNRGWRPNTSPETNGIPVVIPLQLKVVKEQLHALRIENHILAVESGAVAEHRRDRERVELSKNDRQHERAGSKRHRTHQRESGRRRQLDSFIDGSTHGIVSLGPKRHSRQCRSLPSAGESGDIG